jgi:hypothetical protein
MNMVKRLALYVSFFVLFWVIHPNYLFSQKGDYNWLSGYDSYLVSDSSGGVLFGNTLMNFSESPVNIRYDSLSMNFDFTNTSYSDSDGNLLFYTNGIYIANSFNEMIENSDSLNAGWLQYDWDPSIQTNGYRIPEGVLIFPSITTPGQYLLIHSFIDSVPGSDGGNVYCSKIYATLVDMNLNNSHGGVLYKNKTILQGNLAAELTATRHGNGRDWWILVQERNTNCYYKLVIDTGGVTLMPDQYCWGEIDDSNDIAATCFSPDGSKYIYFSYFNGISIFDFDRCTGELSNPTFIPLTILHDSIWTGMGVAISQSNRFLYVSATEQVYQYDLTTSDIAGSIDTVAIYHNYLAPFGSYFNTEQIGPDGKIYISCGNADSVYHVINNPDAKGVECNFVQHGVHLPSVSWGLPNFPK